MPGNTTASTKWLAQNTFASTKKLIDRHIETHYAEGAKRILIVRIFINDNGGGGYEPQVVTRYRNGTL